MSIISGFRTLQCVGAATACLFLASAVQGHPCAGGGDTHKHCGGGGGGGGDPSNEDRPLIIKVECDPGSLCPIADDGHGDYVHGTEGVQAELQAGGSVLFNGSSAGKSTTPARGLNWNHSVLQPIVLASGTYTTLENGQTTSVEGSTYNYHSQIQINRRGDLDLEAMTIKVGDMEPSEYEYEVDLWAQVVIHDPKHPSIVAHRYDGKTATGDPNAQDECTSFQTQDVKIVRTMPAQWVVTAPAGLKSCALIQDPNAARPDRLKDTAFEMAPFRIIIQLVD